MPSRSVPVWQNGTPQSMQRAPCFCSVSSSLCSWNSSQSRVRTSGGRASGSSRGYSKNPVGLPITTLEVYSMRCQKVLSELLHPFALFSGIGHGTPARGPDPFETIFDFHSSQRKQTNSNDCGSANCLATMYANALAVNQSGLQTTDQVQRCLLRVWYVAISNRECNDVDSVFTAGIFFLAQVQLADF